MSSTLPQTWSFAGFTLDLARGCLLRGADEIGLRPKSFEVLKYLVEHNRRLISKEELITAVWPNSFVTPDSLVQCLHEVRRALGSEQIIKTVPRRGYRFEAEVVAAQALEARAASIAVLPFHSIDSHDPEPYLELGVADTLIGRLVSIAAITVMPTSAVRKYWRSGKDAIAAGSELQVDWVVEGSIRRRGERVRAIVHLIDVKAGGPAWSEVFDENFTDIFAVEDAITLRVARALSPRLTGNEQQLLTKRFTDNVHIYQLYLRGRYFLERRTEEGFATAIDCFNQAIAQEPNYAPALAGLADAYSLQGLYAIALKSPGQVYPMAHRAAARALAIDGTLAEAHSAMALSLFNHDWNWLEAEKAFARAIEMNPSYATLYHWYSHFLTAMGRTEQSWTASVRAIELDPHDLPLRSHLIWHYVQARRYDQALEQGRRTIGIDPNFVPARLYTGIAYERAGRYQESVAELEKALSVTSDARGAVILATLGHTFAAAGERGQARRVLQQLTKLSDQQYVSAFTIGLIHAAMNDKDAAFVWLERAYRERDNWLVYLNVDSRLDTLRIDPRFVELVSGMGLRERRPPIG
jgi:DNA-binding winged helix-turn-helix (wHTH) protein/Tfp pilus assembly protein PilF